MKTVTRWIIRIPLTLVAVVLVMGLGTEKTLDPGSNIIACLILIAGTVVVWVVTRKRKVVSA